MAQRRFKVRFRTLTCPTQPERPSRKQRSKYEFFFDRQQQWAAPKIDLDFWDETEDLQGDYNKPGKQVPAKPPVTSVFVKPEITSLTPSSSRAQSDPRLSKSEVEDGWPFHSAEEAFLFRHFQRHILNWVDVSDRHRCFRQYIRSAVHESPMILYAICALSAHHLSRTAGHSALIPLLYQEKCLSLLLPMLGNDDSAKDLSVLVTTTTLRAFEELDSPSATEDEQRHLLGTSVLLKGGGPMLDLSSEDSSVMHTVVWCYLRQELYVSFALQQAMRCNFENLYFDSTKHPTCDISWANRLVWHTTEVMRWAFGDGGRPMSEYNRLQDIFSTWEQQWPTSFRPICRREADPVAGRLWPDIWFAEFEHANTAMWAVLSKVVLVLYDPTRPQMGRRARAATDEIRDKLQKMIRELCGVALTNDFGPAWNGACTLITTIGIEWITDRTERQACVKFLEAAEPKSGWPTQRIVSQLKQEWNV